MAEATTCAEVPSTGSCSNEAPAGCYDEEASWREARAYLVADVIPDIEARSGSCSGKVRCFTLPVAEVSALRSCCGSDVRGERLCSLPGGGCDSRRRSAVDRQWQLQSSC